MKTCITALIAFYAIAMTVNSAFAQKTQVSVQSGKVKAQTQAGTVTVNAGQKGVLKEASSPVVAIDDPMVDDLIQMNKWVEAEKKAGKIRIDSSSIQIVSIDNDKIWKGAGLDEFQNDESQPTNICKITGTLILEDPKYYDMDGNLLAFELEQTSKFNGNYSVHMLKPVAPGDKFKFIMVAKCPVNIGFWNDGFLWHQVMENNPRYCVNYFRVILPKSAIFISNDQDIITADSIDGRIAITTRNYTGANARGSSHITFLWPEKDGKSIADLAQRVAELGDTMPDRLSPEETSLIKKLDSVAWDKADANVAELYTEFCDTNVRSPDPWFTLGIKLVGGGYWQQALGSFEQCCTLSRQKISPDYIASMIWQGHMYDLLGKRDEAVSKYKKALSFLDQFKNSKIVPDLENYVFMRHDQWGIKLSYNWVRERLDKPFVTSLFTKDVTQSDMFKRFQAIPWDNGGTEILDLYTECLKDNKIFEDNKELGKGWLVLGIKLVGGGYWDQAFDAFSRAEKYSVNNSLYYFAALVWEGHIYDIKGMRNEALAKYKKALEVAPEDSMRHDQWKMVIDYKWVKARIETPFTKQMVGK